MSQPEPLSQWIDTVSRAFPQLSRPQAQVLALWSYGMVIAKSCGITLVCAALALQLGCSEGSLLQRLREWCYSAKDKKGKDKKGHNRRELEVSTCFAPLLKWILSWWPADEPRLALALDATTLAKRFTVLVISVVYRGCAIPVAWKVVGAVEKGSWEPHWLGLLQSLAGSVPEHWTVIVMSDRGLYAPWLYAKIVSLRWHPFMRINKQGHFRALGEDHFRSLASAAPTVGSAWCGKVDCFSQEKSRLRCTLLARWDEGYEEVWLIVTDLAPEQATAVWYGMRSWIEGGFKDTKRGGWHWHQTKMTDAERAERLWLAIAVATLWVVSVLSSIGFLGGEKARTEASAMMMRKCMSASSARRKRVSCQDRLSSWKQEVSRAFAQLSKAQVYGLVLWSAGIALTGSSGINQISALLAQVLEQKEGTVFQRLREWYLDAHHKRGDQRRELEVASCFGPLLRWIVERWAGQERRLALALDASTLADRWTVLSISVLIRGCAIPVAWKVIGAHAKGSWRPYWEGMLERLQGSVPTEWDVLVLADRGLYANWLYAAIVACGWHPFLRINLGVKARADGEQEFDWISRWIPAPGAKWQGVVDCFVQKKSRLRCTLLMQWETGYEHAWVVLTDLAPDQANVAWYGLRSWIEAGFKDVKRGGLGWHHSKMLDAERLERLWLAMAVAMVWMVGLGSQADSQRPVACWEQLPQTHIARRRLKRAPTQQPVRRLSCLQRGRLVLVAALFRAEPLPLARFVPEPWPETITPPKKGPKPSQQRQRQKRRARKKRQKAAQHRKVAA